MRHYHFGTVVPWLRAQTFLGVTVEQTDYKVFHFVRNVARKLQFSVDDVVEKLVFVG